ncbi:MAG TPA: anion transporter [Acidobacteriota bacterium]|jgi:Na+/H+ antiporter NhaD/arsenite permease-like protein
MSQFTIALLIFLVTYAVIAIQQIPRLHIGRPAGALLGAVAMVLFGVLPLREAYQAIDMDTILFLLGMMIQLAYLELSGFFEVFERALVGRARSVFGLLRLVIFSSGLLSAVFMNDTICLLLTPVIVRVTRRLQLNPVPFLIGIATAANIGSAMTIIGNPQNAMIGVKSGVSFMRFTWLLWPISLFGLLIDLYLIAWIYRKEIVHRGLTVPAPRQPLQIDRPLFAVSTGCGTAMVILLCLGYPPAGVAMGLGALNIIAGAAKPREALKRIDWSLLLFFASLFIVIHGVERAGAVRFLFEHLPTPHSARNVLELAKFSGAVALLSNVVSNVPAVLLYVPVLRIIPNAQELWITLAMAATLAGNLTVIGSVANIIVFESAGKEVRVSFLEYLKVGLPLTLLTLAAGIGLIYLRQ